jgi:glycosyltransferase involved in cell wall biosynthesis
MIVKNEESVLGRCLDSVKDIVDEIIIVDTGSSDKTKEIAAKYTNRIYDFEWIDDFSVARNFSFEKAISNAPIITNKLEISSKTLFCKTEKK